MRHGFRNWLVRRLADTAYAREVGDPAPVAARIGVTPAVLLEARAVHSARVRAHGLPVPMGANRAGHRRVRPQVLLTMPKGVFDAWIDYCDSVKLRGSVVLRSAVDIYLRSDWEPEICEGYWRVNGETWRAKTETEQERALITDGADRALRIRAAVRGTTLTALLRGLVTELLEGRVPAPRPIAARAMWDDAKLYLAASGHADVLDGPEGSGH